MRHLGWFVGGPIAVAALVRVLTGCHDGPPKVPASSGYAAKLAACTATSKTCAESIACENDVRAEYHREPRDASKGCN